MFDAIETHYVGPTDTKGSRIIANFGFGCRIIVPYRSELSSFQNHEMAAKAIIRKENTFGRFDLFDLIPGVTRKGYVFVLAEKKDK